MLLFQKEPTFVDSDYLNIQIVHFRNIFLIWNLKNKKVSKTKKSLFIKRALRLIIILRKITIIKLILSL